MKEFKKTENGLFICEECGKIFIKKDGLSKHINKFHACTKQYHDKWIKEENEGICVICGNEAKFRNMFYGYNYVCENKECLYIYLNIIIYLTD